MTFSLVMPTEVIFMAQATFSKSGLDLSELRKLGILIAKNTSAKNNVIIFDQNMVYHTAYSCSKGRKTLNKNTPGIRIPQSRNRFVQKVKDVF